MKSRRRRRGRSSKLGKSFPPSPMPLLLLVTWIWKKHSFTSDRWHWASWHRVKMIQLMQIQLSVQIGWRVFSLAKKGEENRIKRNSRMKMSEEREREVREAWRIGVLLLLWACMALGYPVCHIHFSYDLTCSSSFRGILFTLSPRSSSSLYLLRQITPCLALFYQRWPSRVTADAAPATAQINKHTFSLSLFLCECWCDQLR